MTWVVFHRWQPRFFRLGFFVWSRPRHFFGQCWLQFFWDNVGRGYFLIDISHDNFLPMSEKEILWSLSSIFFRLTSANNAFYRWRVGFFYQHRPWLFFSRHRLGFSCQHRLGIFGRCQLVMFFDQCRLGFFGQWRLRFFLPSID